MDSSVKGGIEIKTDRHSHSGKRPRIEDSPICSDEIETQTLMPRHSGKRRRLEDNTIRSDDDDHKQIETHKGEGGKTTHRKSVKQKAPACPKCRRRRDRARAKTEKPPLPEGCSYLCLESGVDADGHYYEVLSNLVGYMSCLRCGMYGDHWDAYCPNPINDPPESEETAAARLSWKYILRDFNPKQQIDREIEIRKGPKSLDRACITSLVKGGTKMKTEMNRHSGERPRLKDTTVHSDDLLAACDIEIETHKGDNCVNIWDINKARQIAEVNVDNNLSNVIFDYNSYGEDQSQAEEKGGDGRPEAKGGDGGPKTKVYERKRKATQSPNYRR